MKFALLYIALLFGASYATAQDFKRPPNAKPGKCYKHVFEFDKEIAWEEIECNQVNDTYSPITKEKLEEIAARTAEMRAYQLKLQSLGYDVDITGMVDENTIIAHHKYLRALAKAERKKRREARKTRKK